MAHAPWFDDWEQRAERMVQDGLPVLIKEARIEPGKWGFIGLYFDIEEDRLPRSHTARGFELHYSIGFLRVLTESGCSEAGVRELVVEINRRYAGTRYIARIKRLSGGATAVFDPDDPLILDPVISLLHSRGGYEWKKEPHHISM